MSSLGLYIFEKRRIMIGLLTSAHFRWPTCPSLLSTIKAPLMWLFTWVLPLPMAGYFPYKDAVAPVKGVVLWRSHGRLVFTMGITAPGKLLSTNPMGNLHYSDVIMGAMASQITRLTIVYSTVYSGADQRKHQSSASLAFMTGDRWIPRSNDQ